MVSDSFGPKAEPQLRWQKVVFESGLSLITLGVVVLLFLAYQLFGTDITEHNSQEKLKKEFNAAITTQPGGTSGSKTTSTTNPNLYNPNSQTIAIGHLVIPKAGVNAYLVQGTAEQNLKQGPGHYPNTPLPGQAGNAAIAGHRTTYGHPFYNLQALSAGDPIYITMLSGITYTYKVAYSEVVKPSDISVLAPTSDSRLTLTTCNPRYSASTRLVVVSELQGAPAAATPTHHSGSIGIVNQTPTNLGTGESGAYLPAFLYGLLALALWIMVRLLVARRRGIMKLAFLTPGIVICLIPMWFCFENVVSILPQSI